MTAIGTPGITIAPGSAAGTINATTGTASEVRAEADDALHRRGRDDRRGQHEPLGDRHVHRQMMAEGRHVR